MKTMKLLLKIGGIVIIALGVACLVVGYMDQIKRIFPKRKCCTREFADYADVDCE